MFPVGSSAPGVLVVGAGAAGETLSGRAGGDRGLRVEITGPDAPSGGVAADHATDVVLVDGRAVADPDAVVESVLRERPDLPLVLVTDGWGDERIADALSAGVAETLPARLADTDPDTFLDRVVSVIDREHGDASFQQLYDNLAGVATLHDPETGELIHANRTLCSLVDVDRESLLAGGVSGLTADVPGYDTERAQTVFANATAGDPLDVEWPIRTADGGVRWLEARVRRVSIGGRAVVLSTSVDVTERRRQERRYEQVFDNVNDGISVHDPWEETMVDVNETLAALTGYSRETLLEMDVGGVSAAEDGFTEREAYDVQQRVAASGEAESVEWKIETAAGDRRVLESNLAPATIGGEDRVLALSRDVTERREYERRLERERDRRSVLFENNPDPVLRVSFEDDGPIIREVNPVFEEVFGFSPDEVVGEGLTETLVPEDRRADHERLRERVSSGEPLEMEVPRRTADGIREFLFRVIHFTSGSDAAADGPTDAYVWYTDVTERNRRERVVRRLHESTQRVQTAETRRGVCATTMTAATEVLDVVSPTCWLDDETIVGRDGPEGDAGSLTPLVPGGDGPESAEAVERPTIAADLPDGLVDSVFETGESRVVDIRDGRAGADGGHRGDRDETGGGPVLLVPLGDHGVFGAIVPGAADDDVTLDAARTLAGHATTALDRVERARDLRESERRFQLIADRIDEVIFLSEPDFSDVAYVNQAYEDLWGRPTESLYDNPREFIDVIDPRDRETFKTEFEAMLAEIEGGEADDNYVFEYRVRPTDDTVRWVRATGYPVTVGSPDGESRTRFVGIVEDITERRELEETYRGVFESVSDGLVIHDPETGEILDVNDRFCEMNGYDRADLVGQRVDRITGPGHEFERARDRIRAAREEGPQLFEWRNQRKDGETYPVEVHLSVVDIRGEERVLASVRDITERKRRKREYEQIFDGVTEAIVVQDPETAEPLDANQAFLDRLGYDDIDAIRQQGFEALSAIEMGFTKQRAQELCHRVMETGTPETVEWAQETKDGDRRWIEAKVDAAEIQGEDRILSMQRDVTERKRHERTISALNEATDALQDADSPRAVCEAAVTAATEVLNLSSPVFWIRDRDSGRDHAQNRNQYRNRSDSGTTESVLSPVAAAEEASTITPDDDRYEVFTRGQMEVREPGTAGEGDGSGADPAFLVPLGEHGLFGTVESDVDAFDDVTLDAAQTLARHVTAALDRVERARELRESERRFRLIANHIDEVVYLATADFSEILYVNDAYADIYGRPVESLDERPTDFLDAVHPDDRERYEADLEEMTREVDSGAPRDEYDGTYRIVRDGEVRWLTVTRFPVGNEDGTVDRIVGRVQDVTERTRREQEYEQIFNGVTDPITINDPETGEIVAVNDAMCDLLGYDREEILDRNISGISVTEEGYTMERAREEVRRIVEAGETETLEWKLETADGEHRWLEVRGSPAEIGGEERYLSITRDVTERRRTERQLSELLDRIDETIFMTRADELVEPTQSPDYVSSGYEAIWGQPLEEIEETYEEGFFGTLHPDDEAEYRQLVVGILDDIEEGAPADSYDHEYRIERPDGEVRWVHSTYYPTEWGGGVPRVVVVSRDVTDRKARERRIASFDEATDDLATADTPREATRAAVEAATETLGLPAVGAFLYEPEEGVLEPEALTGPLSAVATADPIEPGDGPLWEAFAAGGIASPDGGQPESGLVDDRDAPLSDLEELAEWRGLALGNHGILLVGSPDSTMAAETIQAAHVLAATLEAALNHLQGQQRLAAQEEQLRTQTERADRLDRIARLTHKVEAAITDATDPGEIERAVCERLADSGPYDLAWVGGVDVGTDRLVARSIVGAPDRYVESMDLTTTAESADPHPAVTAWRSDEVRIVDSLVGDGPADDWRRQALSEGYQSLCAVPLTYDGVTHGVLTVGTDAPSAFGDRERDVLAQLGTSIANAVAAIERRRALESDETVELEFSGAGESLSFTRAARAADCRVRHERTVVRQDGPVSVYFSFEGDLPSDAPTIAERTLPGTVEVVTEESDSVLVESRTADWFGTPLAEYGGVLRKAVADPEETTVTVEVPRQADVRSFADRLQTIAPSLELTAKRQHRRQSRTPAEISDQLQAELTDRQFEVLRTALSAGYFEWPREHDGREVADRLDITQPTFNKHLRLAERQTFELLFGLDSDE